VAQSADPLRLAAIITSFFAGKMRSVTGVVTDVWRRNASVMPPREAFAEAWAACQGRINPVGSRQKLLAGSPSR
jgi:hypothetical protein